jgi:hypothetical protein
VFRCSLFGRVALFGISKCFGNHELWTNLLLMIPFFLWTFWKSLFFCRNTFGLVDLWPRVELELPTVWAGYPPGRPRWAI